MANSLQCFVFFSSSPHISPLHCLHNMCNWDFWCSSLGDVALYDALTTCGNFIHQKWILPVVLVQVIQENCVILSVQLCGKVDNVQWGTSPSQKPLCSWPHIPTSSLGLALVIARPVCELPWTSLKAESQSSEQLWLANNGISRLKSPMENREECQSWNGWSGQSGERPGIKESRASTGQEDNAPSECVSQSVLLYGDIKKNYTFPLLSFHW